MTAVVVTVALLGLCAGAAAAPMDAQTRTNELDDMPTTIPRDLDFPSPLIAQEVVFDPYSDPPDGSYAPVILPLNTALAVPEPPPLLLFTLGLACLAILVAIRRLPRFLRGLRKPGRRKVRRKVRREFRMMA